MDHMSIRLRESGEEISDQRHDIVAALAYPQLKQRFADIATSVTPSTPAELAALLKSDMELWGPIIKASNIKGE